MTESTQFGVVSLIVIVVLFLYSVGGAFFEAKHIHIIHETGLGILLGIFSGFLFYLFFPTSLDQLSDFNNEVFFYVLLPVIIFSGGYNLNKKRFFQNFLYINLFGVIGTIICFLLIVFATSYINDLGYIRKWDDLDVSYDLNIYQIMIFSATICATDSVAGLTMIKPDKHPKLFSVVFGEGLVNDAVAIIIFLALGDLTTGGSTETLQINFEWYTSFKLAGLFLKDFILSLLIGLLMGLFTTWAFKQCRFLTHSCILETAIILYMGYVSFTICELTKLSGVISVLVTGIVLAHYNFYNISPIGKISSQVTIQTLSFVCEAAIYVYLGISLWTLKATDSKQQKIWSWTFVLWELLITFAARAVAMLIVSGFWIMITGRKGWRLSIWELIIIWFAGLIRGSIAYALIQQVQSNGVEDVNIQLLKNTILIMVILTTVVIGGLMPLVINVNMRQLQKQLQNPLHQDNSMSIRDTLIGQVDVTGESESSKRYRSQLQRLFKRLDDKYIKPCLIHDFAVRKQEIERSKRMLKMNHQDFDPTQFGRLTMGANQMQVLRQTYQNINQDGIQLRQSQNRSEPKRQTLSLSQVDNKQIMTKVTLRSSYSSKFMGNQQFSFDFDVPVQIVEDPSEDSEANFQNENDAENSSSLQDNKTNHREISISKIVPK